MAGKDTEKQKRSQCPICGKQTADEYKPFCSKRCADVDLNRWLGEAYRIPAEEAPVPGDIEGFGED